MTKEWPRRNELWQSEGSGGSDLSRAPKGGARLDLFRPSVNPTQKGVRKKTRARGLKAGS